MDLKGRGYLLGVIFQSLRRLGNACCVFPSNCLVSAVWPVLMAKNLADAGAESYPIKTFCNFVCRTLRAFLGHSLVPCCTIPAPKGLPNTHLDIWTSAPGNIWLCRAQSAREKCRRGRWGAEAEKFPCGLSPIFPLPYALDNDQGGSIS